MAEKTNISPSVYKAVHKFRVAVEEAGFRIASFYVFGSQIKGKAKKWSDIDVAVISPDFNSDRHTQRVHLMKISDKIDDSIEPHPFTPEEFDDKYYTLAQEVKRTGVKI